MKKKGLLHSAQTKEQNYFNNHKNKAIIHI